jgi:hypothetical protein
VGSDDEAAEMWNDVGGELRGELRQLAEVKIGIS